MPDYSKYDTLRDYALWYYFRYYPSSQKLKSKLFDKSKDTLLVNKVFDNIKNLINEREVIDSKINTYLIKNKNINYIKSKLLEKLFDKDMVLDILEEKFLSKNQSLLSKDFLYREVTRLKNNNKSISYIKNKLIDNQNDKSLVLEVIDDVFEGGESDIIISEIDKLSWKFDNTKIIQKLLQKWFKYSDIKKYI